MSDIIKFDESDFLEFAFKKREYDGKVEKIAKVLDRENSYTYKKDNGTSLTIVPTRWITVEVLNN